MSTFENAAGISMVEMNYFFIVLFIVLTIIGVSVGFIDLLKALRTRQVEGIGMIASISQGIAAIIAAMAIVYFITL